MSENITVNITTPQILQQIENQFGIKQGTILRAIAIKSVGHEHKNSIE